MSELVLRAGEWDAVTPESAEWNFLSFRVATQAFESEPRAEEVALVPLRGRCRVTADGQTWEIGGRESVFAGLPWALYLPRDTGFRVEPLGDLELAVCGARCERRREPVLIEPGEIEVEIRGAGNATRQINHILKPEFRAERLLVVEVFTPAGNWSGSPPHKHDTDNPPGEVDLEETYYYRLSAPEGFALQRLYSPERSFDVTVSLSDGDLMLIPWGYHTTAASPGYDLYYLNALAGERRSMAAADDPAFAWQRAAWDTMARDPRVPLVRTSEAES